MQPISDDTYLTLLPFRELGGKMDDNFGQTVWSDEVANLKNCPKYGLSKENFSIRYYHLPPCLTTFNMLSRK